MRDAEAVIERRLITASREIQNYDKYDYILINDKLEDSSEILQAIVLSERLRKRAKQPSSDERRMIDLAEHSRLTNVKERLEPILASFGVPSPSARP